MTSIEPEVVPAAVDALLGLWRSALPGCEVIDSEPVSWAGGTFLTVGYSARDDAVEAVSVRSGLGRRRGQTALIGCALWVAGGDTRIAPYRATAFELFAMAKTLVRDNPTLSGAVTRAQVTGFLCEANRGPNGAGYSIEFTVEATAL